MECRSQTASGDIQSDYTFFQGEELSYLWKTPLRDTSHEMVHDYANGRHIDIDETYPDSDETYLTR